MKLIKDTQPIMILLLLGASPLTVLAELSDEAVLRFAEGSKISIEASPGFWDDIAIQADKGVVIGTAQIDKSIDTPSHLFGQSTQHLSGAPVGLINAEANSAQLDFSAWAMAWKDSVISLGTGGSNAQGDGVATVQCDSSCSKGEAFTLDYSATVPADVETLGGLGYRLHLVGTIQ